MNDWRSVKERLPERGRNTLIFSKEGGVSEGAYIGGNEWAQYRWSTIVTATHWMDMPEPPKEFSR